MPGENPPLVSELNFDALVGFFGSCGTEGVGLAAGSPFEVIKDSGRVVFQS